MIILFWSLKREEITDIPQMKDIYKQGNIKLKIQKKEYVAIQEK